jgi:Spy/CpxP family protein refolding chaperone
MKMQQIRLIALIGIIAAVAALGTALAQGPGGRFGRGGAGRPAVMGRGGGLPLHALNLSEAQRQQTQALTDQHREQHRATAERLRAVGDAHRKAVEALPLDEQAIRTTFRALADVQEDMAVAQAKLRAAIFALLTPEQQAEAAKIRDGRGGGRSGGRQRMPLQRVGPRG